MFVSVAWHVPSDLYRLILSDAGYIPPKKASDVSPSLGISEARLPKLVGVVACDVGSNASNDRSEFTQAHTRSITSKMLWHIAWNCQELCIPNCLLDAEEIPRVFVKIVTIRPPIQIENFPPATLFYSTSAHKPGKKHIAMSLPCWPVVFICSVCLKLAKSS